MSHGWCQFGRKISPAIPFAALCAAVAVVCVATPLHGETPEDDDGDDGITVRTVDVQSTDEQRDDERFASGVASRVDAGELSFRGQTLTDALEHVPGVHARRDAGFGQPAHLSVRGGNPRQMVVELDGLRLSAPVGVGFDAGRMMTQGIESADVIRGSGAAVYGAGAVTGAMRLNSARAPDESWELQGRTMAGSFGTAELSATAGAGEEDAGLRVHGGARQSRGDFEFVDDQGVVRQRVGNDHQRVALGATGHLEEGSHQLQMTGRWETGDAGSPGPSEFQKSSGAARVDDHRGLAILRWEADEVWKRPDWIVDGHATAGVQQRAMRYRNDEGLLTREPFESRATQRTVAVTGGLQALVGSSHLARLDVEGRFESYDGEVDAPTPETLRAFRRTAAVSVADEWLLADERISLVGALRTEVADGRRGQSVQAQPFAPAVGAIGRIHDRLELRANAARTFRLPDFDELYLQTEGVRGNPDLDPERAWTADAGVRLGADDDLMTFRTTAFAHAIDSTILFLPVSAYLFEAQNLRGATSRGVEASARFRLGERWTIDGSYTHTMASLRADADGGSTQLPGQPRHRATLQSALDSPGQSLWSPLGKLQWSSTLHYRSKVHLDNFGNLQNPSALRVDIGATARLSARFRAALRVDNLFDHRRAQDSLHRPLPGRAFFVSTEMRAEGTP